MEEIIKDGSDSEAFDSASAVIEDNLSDSAENEKSDEITEKSETDGNECDVEGLLRGELEDLKKVFPELSSAGDITEIKNPLRYAALRDLGLSPTEAYLAARGVVSTSNNRAHLSASVPRVTGRSASMPKEELERAREIFFGMSDSDIQRLWRKVNK